VATTPTQTLVAISSLTNCEATAEGQVSATGQVAPTSSHPKESAELAATHRILEFDVADISYVGFKVRNDTRF
jgi:hypothetical protein